MTNPHGTPIWYELATSDADAASAFYAEIVGWTIEPRPPGDMDYRMIAVAEGDNAGAIAGIGAGTPAAAATPGWRFYIGVDDVDATAAAIVDAGGSIAIQPFDLPGVGRMALAADPQGIAFFVMRGASPEDSHAWDRSAMGKCNWNELATPDHAAANTFYGRVFGWTYPDRMAMPGEMGDYVFIDAAGQSIGASMQTAPGAPAGWTFYFRVADIEAAAASMTRLGGTIHMGPHEVPGGDRVIVASDPEGLMFGLVGAGTGA